MKITFLVISLILNAALLGYLYLPRGESSREIASATTRTQVLTKTIVQEMPAVNETNNVPEGTNQPFHWSTIQSTNFGDYVKGLQAIGCPPQTIRDIVGGEINDWMLAQRRALITPYAPRFWDLAAKGELDGPTELREPLKELKLERDRLMEEALKGVTASDSAPKKRTPRKDETLSMLSEEKLAQIKQLDEKYADLFRNLNRSKDPDKNQQLMALQAQQEKEKQALMSPEELAEYKIRREASSLNNLYGFDTNQEELRKIAEVYSKHSLWMEDPGTISTPEARAEKLKSRDEELKATLGEARYAEFKRGSNPLFRDAYQIARAYQLPKETAVKAFQLQEANQERRLAIQKDGSLTPEQRQASLEQLQDELEDANIALFGPKAAAAFKKRYRQNLR